MTKRSLTDEREGLSVACLGLLNLVLSQWFKPSGHRGSPVDAAYHEARLMSLEKKTGTSETSCASDLCTILLSSYDSNMFHCSGHKNCTKKCLLSHTLAVLLASSDSAKATALKGLYLFYIAINWSRPRTIRLLFPTWLYIGCLSVNKQCSPCEYLRF